MLNLSALQNHNFRPAAFQIPLGIRAIPEMVEKSMLIFGKEKLAEKVRI